MRPSKASDALSLHAATCNRQRNITRITKSHVEMQLLRVGNIGSWRDYGRDLRYGSRADIRRDFADIRRDRRDLRYDREDIRRDRRDLFLDRYGH